MVVCFDSAGSCELVVKSRQSPLRLLYAFSGCIRAASRDGLLFAYQGLCFPYTDSTIPLLSKFKASSQLVVLEPSLCFEYFRNPEDRFSLTRLKFKQSNSILKSLHHKISQYSLWFSRLWDHKSSIFHPCHEKKPVFGVSDQVLHKLGCTTTEDG